MAFEHLVGLLPTVAPEIGVEQIDHSPEMAAFLDIHLIQVAQVIERRRGAAQLALLLNRGGLGVPLGDDQAAQLGAILGGDLVPDRLALVGAEGDLPVGAGFGQEDAPAIVGHLHMVEMGPAVGVHADGGAQIDLDVVGIDRPHVLPPLDVGRLPALECAQQAPVVAQIDVVGDGFVVVSFHDLRPACGRIQVVFRCQTAPARRRHPRRWGAGRSSSARRSAARKSCFRWSRGRGSANSPPCP